jgi:hypothetical protein
MAWELTEPRKIKKQRTVENYMTRSFIIVFFT